MDYQNTYLEKNKDLHNRDSKSKTKAILELIPDELRYNSVLDIACGSGKIILEISKIKNIKKIIGVDISKKIIDIAKDNDKQKKVEWVISDVFNLELLNIDLVLAIDIIEHLKDENKFLEKISNIGKYLIIKVPIEDNYINRIIKFLSYNKIDTTKSTRERYGHINYYTENSFLKLIEDSKFNIIRKNYMHLPKRSKFLWEMLRLLFFPLWFISKKNYVRLNGGFLLLFLVNKNFVYEK